MRKPENQWAESAAMRELQRQGAIEKMSFGENIEVPLDYRPNPDIAVMASDQDTATLLNTEVITSAVYDIAQVSEPVVWTKAEEVKNPAETQKIALVKAKLENAINSHDDLFEQLIFTTSSSGGVEFNGLDTLVPTSGLGSPGGIAAATEAFWANYADTYLADGSDIEAAMQVAFNTAMKGSGSSFAPKFLLSGQAPHSLFNSTLTTLQRFNDTSEADAGFKVLAFNNARYVFSQYGDDKIYFLNPKSYKILCSKQYFRDQGETVPVPGQNASYFLVYSAAQAVTNQKSRLAVLSQA